MREFAAFDRRGRLLWTSANFSPVETLGLTAWSHCDPESVEVIQKAVGLAIAASFLMGISVWLFSWALWHLMGLEFSVHESTLHRDYRGRNASSIRIFTAFLIWGLHIC